MAEPIGRTRLFPFCVARPHLPLGIRSCFPLLLNSSFPCSGSFLFPKPRSRPINQVQVPMCFPLTSSHRHHAFPRYGSPAFLASNKEEQLIKGRPGDGRFDKGLLTGRSPSLEDTELPPSSLPPSSQSPPHPKEPGVHSRSAPHTFC